MPREWSCRRRRCLKKNAVESRLERAPGRFADPKRETDFGLSGAMHLDFGAGRVAPHRRESRPRQFRLLAIAAEMTEHHPLRFPGSNCSITVAAAVFER